MVKRTSSSKGTGVETVRLDRRQKTVTATAPPVAETRAVVDSRPVAVVDCGSSSVRAFIAEISGDHQRILEDLVYPVDLTAGFTGGTLDKEDMDAVDRAFTAVMAAAKGYGIGAAQVRAVATSALREAANSDVLIQRLAERHAVELEVLDGPEEARIYHEALRVLCGRLDRRLEGNTLLIDVGGGSTCIGLIREGTLVHSVDEHFGTIRCWQDFRSLRDSADLAVTIDRFCLGAARMILGRLPEREVTNLVVTGGEVRRLAALLDPKAVGLLDEVDPLAVAAWFRRMGDLTPLRRAEACGTDLVGVGRLLPAAALVRHLCVETGAASVLVPHITLRDGLLADFRPGAHGSHHMDPAHLLAEARQLVKRYGGNLPYAENTASLAVQLFDQTKDIHHLGERERTLLEFSALVHDIGSYVNVRNRHKHTMYLIQGSDIAGLTGLEQDMVANIARYHRKSPPEPHHEEFVELPRRERVVVRHLAALLRLAYALDVERTQRIRRVQARVDGNRLLIRVDRRQIALEQWSVAGKAQLFEEVSGLEVAVIPREGA